MPPLRVMTLASILLLSGTSALPKKVAQSHCDTFVNIHSQKGTFLIKGEFYVKAPLSTTWSVLTDYAHISDFIGSVNSSEILEHEKTTLLIRQEISGKVFFIDKAFSLKLLIHEYPREMISFTDISQKNFAVYEGSWQLSSVQGKTRVIYQLKAKPTGWTPWILGKRVFKSNARKLLDEIRLEIIRRTAG